MRPGKINITIVVVVISVVALGGMGFYWWASQAEDDDANANVVANVNADAATNTNSALVNETEVESVNDNLNAVNTNDVDLSNTNAAEPGASEDTLTTDKYSVEYPSGWYPHDQIDYIIFTKSEELVIPEATEGYAIGPQFITRVQDLVDADDQPLTETEWKDLYIGDQDIDGNPIDKTEVTRNGYSMLRVVQPAAGSSGETLTYYYFAGDEVYTLYHYPYEAGSSDSADFELLVSTFNI